MLDRMRAELGQRGALWLLAAGGLLGAAAVFAPLPALVLAAATLFVFLLVRGWPTSGMVVLLAAALLTHFKFDVGPVSVRPEHVAALVVGALLLWQIGVHRRPFRFDAASVFALTWFLINVLATLLHAPNPGDSLRHIFRLGLLVATYWVAINLLRTPQQWWIAFRWFLLLAVAEDLFGIVARVAYEFGVNLGVQLTWTLSEPVPYGTLEEGNMFGSHSAAWLILFLALFLAQARWRTRWRLPLLAAIGITALSTLLSFARGAWVALLVGLVLLYVFYSPRRRGQVVRSLLVGIGVPLAVVAALTLIQVLPDTVPLVARARTFTSVLTDATFSQRLADINLALQEWARHPLIGWGPGTFFQLYGVRNYQEAWIANQMARTLQETGVLGLAAFWGFLAAVWWGAIRAMRRARDLRTWAALGGLAIGLVVLQIAFQSTDGTWLSAMWVQAALLAAGARLLSLQDGAQALAVAPTDRAAAAVEQTPATLLFVHSSDELYGSDAVLLELVRRLDRARFRPLVVLPTDIPYSDGRARLSDALAALDIPVRFMDFAVLRRRYLSLRALLAFTWRLWRGSRDLARWLRAEDVRLVHANTSAVLGGALAARWAGLPLVWHVHEIIERPGWLRWLISRLVTGLADRVVAISGRVAEALLGAGSVAGARDRVTVIPDAVDTERFQPQVALDEVRRALGAGPEQVLVGTVGRIHTWKGQEILVAAADLLRERCPQARFAIVGDIVPGQPEPRQALEAAIAEHGLADRVRLAGYRADTPAVMAALNILVLPSTSPEPFGLVVLEAMASGKPVVATAHGGPLEIITDGESGMLVPPRDPAPLAAAIERLAGDPELRAHIGAAAREQAVARFGFGPHVAAFERVYAALLGIKTA